MRGAVKSFQVCSCWTEHCTVNLHVADASNNFGNKRSYLLSAPQLHVNTGMCICHWYVVCAIFNMDHWPEDLWLGPRDQNSFWVTARSCMEPNPRRLERVCGCLFQSWRLHTLPLSVCLHAKLNEATVVTRSGHLIGLFVPAYKCWRRIDLLSDSAPVGGDMSCFSGCYRTFFPVSQTSYKQISKRLV